MSGAGWEGVLCKEIREFRPALCKCVGNVDEDEGEDYLRPVFSYRVA